VSILSSFGRTRHLDDAALARIWCSDEGNSVAMQDPHLAGCVECRGRYAALESWLADVRGTAVAEADEAFSIERLNAQHSQIMRRLEALERPAKVLAFPPSRHPTPSAHSGPQRWVAAAAAAGLIVGLVAGQLVDLRHALNRPAASRATTDGRVSSIGQTRGGIVRTVSGMTGDEAWLYEAAITSPRIPELQSLDEITPRALDIDSPR
jgi:hypothetical protein